MDTIVYLVHGGIVVIGKLQIKKCRKHSAKDNIKLPPIEVAIDIGDGPDYDCSLILEFGPWRSRNCSFQGLYAPYTTINVVTVSWKANVCCEEQSKVAPVVFHP